MEQKRILNSIILGDMQVIYIIEDLTKNVGIQLIPACMNVTDIVERDFTVDSLVQLHLTGDEFPIGFSNGHTMRNSGSCKRMKYIEQNVKEGLNEICITTLLGDEQVKAYHYVKWKAGTDYLEIKTEIVNCSLENSIEKRQGSHDIQIEMLSSFSIGNIFDFETGDRSRDMLLHRMESKWTMEGRMLTQRTTDLQMESTWQNYGAKSVRYGQVGTMPVRGYFPWFALEDQKYDVFLGGILSYAGSWQMEFYGNDKRLAMSGGLADYEYGHWRKRLQPGETLTTPVAYLTSCCGSIEIMNDRLREIYQNTEKNFPKTEESLPIIYNEFCNSWGRPQEYRVKEIVSFLKDKPVDYFVIDAGWYAKEEGDWEYNMGDWNESRTQFPSGLKALAEYITDAGMFPGIWFEFENCGKDSNIYHDETMLLKRDGYPITTLRRRFLNLRKVTVQKYLEEKVIQFIKENHFQYIKVDYNDTIGLGCDHEDSLGEGLRQQVLSSYQFFDRLVESDKQLVLEMCSSGGHRLEPSMLQRCSMASFSDAHECLSIPIVAANVLRLVPAWMNQIWVVLRQEQSIQMIQYKMSAGFLGRMCLSGEVDKLTTEQWNEVEKGCKLYKQYSIFIKNGIIRRYGNQIDSYQEPKGYQIIEYTLEREVLLIVHNFMYNQNVIISGYSSRDDYEIEVVYGNQNIEILHQNDEFIILGLLELDCAIIRIRYM